MIIYILPDTETIYNKYGGEHPKGDHIIFVDAQQDPWQAASVTHNISDTKPYYYVDDPNSGHCVDFSATSQTDSLSLKMSDKIYIQQKKC